AEAGVQQARYELNRVLPSVNKCFYMPTNSTPNAVQTPNTTNGQCPGWDGNTANTPLDQTPAQIGNGASYRYWVTDIGQQSQCNGFAHSNDRCIISIGTVGNQTRRLAVTTGPLPLFPAGIIGLNSVKIGNSLNMTGTVGSDGSIDVGNR